MHQKKSEAQIGKESTGVSSDFNPNQIQTLSLQSLTYKRPLLKSPTLYKFPTPPPPPPPPPPRSSAVNRILSHRRRRLILLLALPFLYFLVSHPTSSLLLDLPSAFLFSAALLLSLNLRLPSLRLLLTLKPAARPKLRLPVFRAGPSRPAGLSVAAYANGDVYEGEVKGGKCSGSGVYYYSMSGRYEGEWAEGKYDGLGVETWARGSRYRGQYRLGLRHGFGVYRFYTGDVYAGEWASGQSHGCGVHTCEDGSRYVGEFKWGVKHGLGHYHFSLQGKEVSAPKDRLSFKETGIHMLVNTLRIKCMVLGYIVLQMAIVMKDPGMKAKGKVLECIHLEMEKPSLVTGKMESLTFRAHRALPILFLLLASIIPEYLMQCRKQEEQLRRPMMWPR
ncbi:flagellar radial spoke protein 1 isoform X2 [Cajanus cajan]|uniref:flagellar radial spoke protein 1 isoform X2 n=1 Tax=Cajanus cajan TaxID=3821 RepID=UPI0010FB7E31|nr:flagellar radial spoke protein 1 isoform X2 [Cajanus cajan]